jgi:predicted phage terminase large subunit-like protein
MLNQNELNDLINQIVNNKKLRTEATRKSHFLFFHMYLADHVEYPTASFQKEMFDLTQDNKLMFLVICAFRGSAKSTYMSLSYPLWAIMGDQQRKHILITSRTQSMVKRIFDNLRKELNENALLKSDMGPFKSERTKWGGGTLELSRYGARVTVASVEEGIRGIRHGKYRPDLIIADDVEDLGSVKTREGRDKTYDWFNGDLIPAGSKNTRIIVIGNLLHEDSLIMRLREEIKAGKRDGLFRFYPLFGTDGECLWPGKYPDKVSIEAEKKKLGDLAAWSREYLLKIISDAERTVHPNWIQYYDQLPPQRSNNHSMDLRYIGIAVDLAISQKESADYTAVVCGAVYGRGKDMRVYILPNIINKRMDFPTAKHTVAELYAAFREQGYAVKLWFDNTSFQEAFGQDLKHMGIVAEGCSTQGSDKRTRLSMTTHLIQEGRILFPKQGVRPLILQLIGFGVERFDDLVDAYTILAIKAMEHNKPNTNPVCAKWDRGPSIKEDYLRGSSGRGGYPWHRIL